MERLARSLRAIGYETLNLPYPSRRATVMELAGGLAPQVGAFAARVRSVHFIGHSLGGLVARAIVARFRPASLGRMVTMGTPHGGSEIADLLAGNRLFRGFYGPVFDELGRAASASLNERLGPVDYPLGSIAGRRALNILAARFVLPRPNDGTVSVEATKIAGMVDHCVVNCDHFSLPGNAEVTRLCQSFLTTGRYGRA
jgi:pimeloyl-ACP methyl ester carboxylesterase